MIVHSPNPLPPDLRGASVVIGNLDGVHLGHQALIATARRYGGPVIALTFTPHPRLFFRPESSPFLLMSDADKAAHLARYGVDATVFLPFTAARAHQPATEFIQEILIDYLGARHVVIGTDFHFGHDRQGNAATIAAAGIDVTALPPVTDAQGIVVSSTRVRECLHLGDIPRARALLGHPWDMTGVVIHGDKRGRELGYPTANMDMGTQIRPAYGVYAAWVQMAAGSWHRAAINIGIRPMFGAQNPLLEAHILDFSGDLYGQILRVRPVQKLRDEARFENVAALKGQMQRDCDAARALLPTPPASA